MRLTTVRRLASATLLAAAACGGDTLAPKDDAARPASTTNDAQQYTATVTGAFSKTVRGPVVAAPKLLQNVDPEFDLFLLDSASSGTGFIMSTGISSPTPGTYTAVMQSSAPTVASQIRVVYLAPNEWGSYSGYHPTAGTVTIESVSATRIVGHFDVDMARYSFSAIGLEAPPNENPIHVVGSFDGPVGRPRVCPMCSAAPTDSVAHARVAR